MDVRQWLPAAGRAIFIAMWPRRAREEKSIEQTVQRTVHLNVETTVAGIDPATRLPRTKNLAAMIARRMR
jgi:hypothetical protein